MGDHQVMIWNMGGAKPDSVIGLDFFQCVGYVAMRDEISDRTEYRVTTGIDGNVNPIGFGPYVHILSDLLDVTNIHSGALGIPSEALVVDNNADSISYSGSWQELVSGL